MLNLLNSVNFLSRCVDYVGALCQGGCGGVIYMDIDIRYG